MAPAGGVKDADRFLVNDVSVRVIVASSVEVPFLLSVMVAVPEVTFPTISK